MTDMTKLHSKLEIPFRCNGLTEPVSGNENGMWFRLNREMDSGGGDVDEITMVGIVLSLPRARPRLKNRVWYNAYTFHLLLQNLEENMQSTK